MNWKDLMTDGFNRVPEFLENVLKGLNQEDLDWMPRADSNSIGWLIWHLTRQQDAQIAYLMGKEQLWIGDGWHARFNRPPDPKDRGFGDSPEQVAAFRSPNVETMLSYHRAVLERSKGYFLTLSNADLDLELSETWYKPVPTVGVRLISVLADSLQHAGQAAYVRGLRQGKGWQRY